jgi:uncharacterized protein
VKLVVSLLLYLALSLASTFALEVPTLTGPVVDQARFLSEAGSRAISGALQNLERKTGIQFQVLIINKLKDESLEGFSIKVVDQWKIGKKGDDRAALFLIVADDRKMRIEVGRGLEGALTDLKSRRILSEVKALFKKGDNDNGVGLGLALMAQTVGAKLEFSGRSMAPRHSRSISSSLIIVVLFLLILFLQYVFPSGRGPGGRGGFGGFGGGGFGGGFGGGSSGGGGWSGGGGGFSGGGSSGDW